MLTGLCYHGVHRKEVSPFNSSGKHLSVYEFDRQMRYLAQKHRVVSIQELLDIITKGLHLVNDYVFISFDDGYQNNLSVATEVLASYGLPAALFVSTGLIRTSSHIWTDLLEDFFLLTPPKTVSTYFNKIIPMFSNYPENPIEKYNATRRHLKKLPVAERADIISNLPTNVYAPNQEFCQEIHRFLTWKELEVMNESGIWSFGSHTVSHYSMTQLSDLAMNEELIDSFSDLEERGLVKRNRFFAYPEGQPQDISEKTREALIRCGVSLAFTAHSETSTSTNKQLDRLAIGRTLVCFENTPFPFSLVN